MKVEHICTANVTHQGATYIKPTWRVEGLAWSRNEPAVKVFVLVTDQEGKLQLLDIDLEVAALTEANVILGLEAWFDERSDRNK